MKNKNVDQKELLKQLHDNEPPKFAHIDLYIIPQKNGVQCFGGLISQHASTFDILTLVEQLDEIKEEIFEKDPIVHILYELNKTTKRK